MMKNVIPVVMELNRFKASLVDVVYHSGVHQFGMDFDKVLDACVVPGRADIRGAPPCMLRRRVVR
jgi:hypothetical protein